VPRALADAVERERVRTRVAQGAGLALMVGGVVVILVGSVSGVLVGLAVVAIGFFLTRRGERRMERLNDIRGADPGSLGWGWGWGGDVGDGGSHHGGSDGAGGGGGG
jgi:hypothetical protein